ncbi:MAG TPA: ROK family protein, partial [Solirubrobacteraceae bacterium]
MTGDCVVGVDLGGTKLLAGVVDHDLRVHHRTRRTVAGIEQGELLDRCVAAVEEAREAAPGEVRGVGFGIPCLIDQRRGVAVVAVNLELAGVRFRAIMAERLGLPVWVDNDANLAALAEHRHGAAQGTREAVLLTLGTGIGGGLILHGEVYRGATWAAGEMGHMVIAEDGPPCQGNCPSRGCLESLASGTALARLATELAETHPSSGLGAARAEGREITGPLVTELAHDGDAAALEALETVGRHLGVGIASLVNIFNPEVVVIGGGVIAAGELLLEPARREMLARALPPS